ncbi:hypothetical protein BL248_16595 [Ralstonia solanacearum]|nr:hypothetical protein BL248_16595 [Ralstonia solanacearum]
MRSCIRRCSTAKKNATAAPKSDPAAAFNASRYQGDEPPETTTQFANGVCKRNGGKYVGDDVDIVLAMAAMQWGMGFLQRCLFSKVP